MGDLETAAISMRFGHGPEGDAEAYSPDRLQSRLAKLDHADLPMPSSKERLLGFNAIAGGDGGKLDKMTKQDVNRYLRQSYFKDVLERIVWAVTAVDPVVERLLAFWSNHFTTAVNKPRMRMVCGPFEREALLPHLNGRFVDLLKAASHHPAMLIYLDQNRSVGPNSPVGQKTGQGLNENLAREILELHTLGVHGGYTQTDVTEFARIMCGWTVNMKRGEAMFARRLAEPGNKVLLGATFGNSGTPDTEFAAALDHIAAQPGTATHIAKKLATHFLADTPPPRVVTALEKVFHDTGGDLAALYRALVGMPEAAAMPLTKARNDRDYLIAALRAAEVGDAMLRAKPAGAIQSALTGAALGVLQQGYWSAPSPAGWPEEEGEWLSPIGLAGRIALIPRLVRQVKIPSPAAFLERALGAAASSRTRGIISQASNREEALGLVFASPEFNRR